VSEYFELMNRHSLGIHAFTGNTHIHWECYFEGADGQQLKFCCIITPADELFNGSDISRVCQCGHEQLGSGHGSAAVALPQPASGMEVKVRWPGNHMVA